jgi:glycosyltransferase involved in cell wall biosynthesis
MPPDTGDPVIGPPRFSVVICTYNHAGLLPGALDSVLRQTFDRSRYEVIVVDNNSTDDTRSVIDAVTRRDPGIRYCLEPAQGIAHARNCGWRHARGRYVAYLDDDCRAPDDWLSVADEIFERASPMVLGGSYSTDFGGIRPRWASDSFNSYGPPFREARTLAHSEYGWLVGGNVFVRKTLFDEIGGFDSRLGHVGQTVAYGEETAFFERASKCFPGSLYYDPRLSVSHLVRPEKLTLWYNVRGAFGAGRSAVRLREPTVRRATSRLLLDAGITTLSLAADVLVRMLIRDRRRYRYARNYVDDHSLDYVRRLGSLYEQASSFR